MDEKEIRSQTKIFILYILNSIQEPLEFTTINDMVLEDGLVNYFDFATSFNELLDKGQISTIQGTNENEPLYVITDEGKAILESYEDDISAEIRDKALRHALRVLAFKREGVKQKSVIEEVENGYLLQCQLYDKSKTIFKTEVFLNDLAYAKQMKVNFDDHADIIYKGVMSLLSGDVNYIFDE